MFVWFEPVKSSCLYKKHCCIPFLFETTVVLATFPRPQLHSLPMLMGRTQFLHIYGVGKQ